MNALRWIVVGVGGGLFVLGSATLVDAEISGGNGCQATGTWQAAGITVDAATVDGVVTIPRSDTVDWQGSVAAPPGAYSGSVWVELPPPLGEVEIDAWSGDSQTTSNSGSHEYDLPSVVPGGVEIVVAGEHGDDNGTCTGSVAVQIEGGPFGSPLTAVSLLGTAATGAGMAAALRPLFRKVG
jgi:hypothetical protein